ncbi:MAG TPA: class II aldolase/adducin family protein [Chloroflexota bacterium]|nr:class II aldolase/adducin family protein [Chloroflexota bacterium]
MVAPADVEGLKELLATGTRILYEHGLVDAFGHLSVRLPGTDRFLINPRQSPALLRPETVLTMTFDGEVVEGTMRANSEWHIHASIYRARPDVQSVVHAHTDMSIIFSMSPVGLRPIFGNMSPQFGAEPLPVYPYPRLITDRAKGDRLTQTLGDRTAVLLRGHGCAVTGGAIPQTVIRLIELERNGRFLQAILAQNRGEPRYWSAEEIAEWGDRGAAEVGSDRYWEYLTTRPRR